jgi:hypothetical protein
MGINHNLKPFSLLNNSFTLLNAEFNERACETHVSKEAGITNSDNGKKNYKNLRFTSVSLKHVARAAVVVFKHKDTTLDSCGITASLDGM